MSNLPSDTPRLPKWIFLVSDAALLAAAFFIGANSARPFSGTAMIAICACVALGVVLGAIPFFTDYARKQDEALDERQRALETLSRTVATSAEQISIAANGLHELLDLSHRNLKHAEQLPHKLQEKIAEFQQLLTTANDEEKEELERELATLRSSDSERLESTADKVHKAAADWAKLEAAAAKHLAAANDALAKLAGTAETGAAKASAEIARALATAQAGGASVINDKLAAALAEIDTQLAKGAGQLTVRATDAASLFDAKLAALETVIARLGTAVAPAAAAPEKPATASEPATATPVENPPPKRARKPRREEPAAEVAAAAAVVSAATTPDAAPEATPIAPPVVEAAATPEPATPLASSEATPPPAAENPQSAIPNPQLEESKPARKRAAKKAAEPEPVSPEVAAEEPVVPPASNEFSQEPPEETRATAAVSADGATRLLVTAYVGIGNRLFVRGEGPGLSRDKGVPLQFVSIGKWRWETADATAPIHVKLYKNDQVECSALGEIALEPGHQAEVTANF